MPVDSERDVVSEKRIKKPKHEINWVDSHVNTFYYVNHNNRKKKCHYVHVNKVWSPSSSLTFYLRSCIIFCLTVIFWATSPSLSRSGVIWHLIYMCHAFTFSFAVLSDTAAHRLKTSLMTITSSISIYFLIRFICLSLSPSLSQPVCHSLSLSYFWLPHSSHTFRLSCLQNSGHKDCDVQYAELDTAALASSPSPRSSALTGPGDLVEYATIQPSSH